MKTWIICLPIWLFLLGVKPATGHETAQAMTEAANALLAAVSEPQQKQIQFELQNKERKNWHFVPKPFEGKKARKGIPLTDLNDDQKTLVFSLVKAGLSHKGYQTARDIMALEQVLWELEQQNPIRDANRYYITLFGNPSEANWAWRFEGHHLSINFTIVDKQVVASTPNFFASNPAEVPKGPKKGLRVLAAEEDIARKLAQSLSEDQLKVAQLTDKPPRDILTRAKPKVDPLEGGIAYNQLTTEQKTTLEQLISTYLNRVRPKIAEQEWSAIKKSGLDKIQFGWAGGVKQKQPHYYRVQGATFLLEYANTQNGANHVHSVWRDFNGDFGEDLLRTHYQETH